ncbi:MAG: CXXX repeat peptide maturase [Bacteroidota bacterium]
MKFLIVPIDKSSISFCYYENPYSGIDPEPISLSTLKIAIDYAQANGLTINFLYGQMDPPLPYRSIIESVSHAKIVPLALANVYPESIVVIESGEIKQVTGISLGPDRNLIVRIDKDRLPQLAKTLPLLFGAFHRLNLCITGLERITETELDLYSQQLLMLAETVADRYRRGDIFELNFLSDRLILNNMKNCEAGCEHLTVGSDGRLYLCPAFLYDNPDISVGDLTDGIHIPNADLLQLDHAPLCSLCDAYHCKRCIYLNKKLTLEINTPSRQQCVASHKERNASEKLFTLLQDLPAFTAMKKIPAIDYNDPFILLQQMRNAPSANRDVKEESTFMKSSNPEIEINDPRLKPRSTAETTGFESVEPGDQSIKEILFRICKMQEEILELLRKEHIH